MVDAKKSQYQSLKEKWQTRHKDLQHKLWQKHGESLAWLSQNAKQLTAGAGVSLLLLTSPGPFNSALNLPTASAQISQKIDKNSFFISDLYSVLPKEVSPLSIEQENKASEILSREFKMKILPELQGKRLNRNYGFIGAEQHLARFPGDTIYNHFNTEEEARQFYSAGMAPGLGAWGYFAPSESLFTEEDKLREKYYIAVPTFLSENFSERFTEYRDFFKYRKMIVVNPQNGKAIVCVIGDSGPAVWTGKHLGGSPEVMEYLEREDGGRKGPVLYFFIDDSENKVPLGPIAL